MNLSIKPGISSVLGKLNLPPFLTNPLLYMVLGLAIMLTAAVLLFSGSGDELNSTKAFEQGQRAVTQLSESVQGFRRLLQDEQVKSLAGMALQDSETKSQLSQYLSGRVSEFREVRLYPANAYLEDTEKLGDNAWIAIDMMMTARETGIAPVQIMSINDQQVIAGLVSIGDGAEQAGFMMVLAEKELLMSGFNMTMPLGGYIALQQKNGRYPPLMIGAYGDLSSASFGLASLNVPGSIFTVHIPQAAGEASGEGFHRLLMFLLGALLMAYGVIKRQHALHPVAELTEDPVMLDSDEGAAGLVIEDAPEKSPIEIAPERDEQDQTEMSGDVQENEPPVRKLDLEDFSFNPAPRKRKLQAQEAPVELTPGIFRAYDIRGIVGKTLDRGIARQVGQALGTLALEQEATPVVVGRDGRHSGPDLVEGMIEGLASTGCDVIDIGAVPTGVLYYAANEVGSGSGVMITGSHNPPDYNGIKAMMGFTTLAGDAITGLYERLQSGELRVGNGQVSQREMLNDYRDRIAGDIQLKRPLKVVADCGNGIGGVCAADILRSIGAEVLPMFDEVDGDFPNHHPDPSEPENLKDLIGTVGLMEADLGVAFDGDADRLGVVTPSGEIIYSDRLMMLFAREIISRNPGAKVIYDVKCTGKLDQIIRDAGGEPEMYKTGHSLIKNRMKEAGAPFAGEMSGHFFFGDRWYGFDCGIYSAARLLEILAMDERTPEEVLGSLPNDINTPELKVHMHEGENHTFVTEFQQKARFADARVSTIDGLRADFDYGWGLVRASNTTPILVVRFEADSQESLEMIKEAFRMQMLAVRSDLQLPF